VLCVNFDGTASFEPLIGKVKEINAHKFNWFEGSYEHSSDERNNYSMTAKTATHELILEEAYSTPNLDGFKMSFAVEPKKEPEPVETGYEAGKLCEGLKYESKTINAPSLFMIYADGTGARLLRDADLYPYIKNLAANSKSEVVEEAVEQGVSVSVLENHTFRQVVSMYLT
jgi:hypothetical protein